MSLAYGVLGISFPESIEQHVLVLCSAEMILELGLTCDLSGLSLFDSKHVNLSRSQLRNVGVSEQHFNG